MRGLVAQLVILALAAAAVVVHADNKFPIVLVHGFSGWGRDELLGFKYWGGLQGDLEQELRARGYTVFTAAVGPFSSNWDRACELYAQIKGGQVDYGDNHSRKHGHKRLGRTFPGLYPQWGDVGADGQINKVHLVGHSMGGQTIRMLTQLLNKGSKGAPVEEAPATSDALFAGGRDWVASITTISTPNQGTLLANGFSEIGDLVKGLVIGVFGVLNVGGDLTSSVYDVKLDQWGIAPKGPSESLSQYIERIFDSPLFAPGFQDICLWSLSAGGAAEENKWVQTLPNVFYYSFANSDTFAWRDLLLRKIQLPNVLTMLLPLQPLGKFLGSRYGPDNGFGEAWQPNDGVVNTISMAKDATGLARAFDGTSMRGQWNLMPSLARMDHLAVVGLTLHTQIRDLYVAHLRLLASLPSRTVSNGGRQLLEAAVPAPAGAVVELVTAAGALNAAAESVQTQNDLRSLCAGTTTEAARNYCAVMLAANANNDNNNHAPRRLRGY